MRRFETLDAWRGICACMIAVMHFRTSGVISNFEVVKNGYLFVDFFFVLSGFVIYGKYHNRLSRTQDLARFFVTRFGRLFPLHAFMLALFVVLEIIQTAPGLRTLASSPAFTGESRSIEAIATNLLMIHGLGVHAATTWNSVSWSISTEFWAYVLFAITVRAFGQTALFAALVACLAAPFFLGAFSELNMATTYQFGFVRCLFGFSAGMLSYRAYEMVVSRLRPSRLLAEALEVSAIVAIGVFVCFAGTGSLSLAAPILFAAAMLVFSKEAGSISRVLQTPPALLLGALSYSIYMTHDFVQTFWDAGGLAIAKLFDYPLLSEAPRLRGPGSDTVFGEAVWQGDLATLAMLGMVIAMSIFTYRWIERPSRDWFRNAATRWSAPGLAG